MLRSYKVKMQTSNSVWSYAYRSLHVFSMLLHSTKWKKKWNQKYWAQMISDCPLVDWIKTKHQKERTNYVTKVCGTHTKKGRKKQTNKQRNSSPLQLLSSISSVYPSSPLHKHTCGWFWFRLAPNADLVLFVSTAHSIPSSQSPVLLHTWRNSRK